MPLQLHPLFGAGEDRNDIVVAGVRLTVVSLHPLFGAGEDRNFELIGKAYDAMTGAAPALRSG